MASSRVFIKEVVFTDNIENNINCLTDVDDNTINRSVSKSDQIFFVF